MPIHAGILSPQPSTSPTTCSEAADSLSKLLLSVCMDILSVRLHACAMYFHTCMPIHVGISSPQPGTSCTTDSEAADSLSKLNCYQFLL